MKFNAIVKENVQVIKQLYEAGKMREVKMYIEELPDKIHVRLVGQSQHGKDKFLYTLFKELYQDKYAKANRSNYPLGKDGGMTGQSTAGIRNNKHWGLVNYDGSPEK